ncbi:MAG: polysaccharide deacetylase family protein [Coriobacteriia bacterium]|nr:polysaccharide deacetylase family protein [Coriobacteriia bacterium]
MAPHVLRFPVDVSLNGRALKIPYGTTLGEVAHKYLEPRQLYGDLLAVDGSVLEEQGGEPPIFVVRTKERDASAPIRSATDINVRRGDDVREDIAEEASEVKPGFTRRGTGPFGQVVDAGQIGVTVRLYGAISEIEVAVEQRVAMRDVEVQFSSFGKSSPKLIALTFDDGPHPQYTPEVLRLLSAAEVPATFFLTGSQVSRYPEVAQQIAAAGHQIANHSYSHRDYRELSLEEVRRDLQRSQNIIETATGVRPTWVRPPYGLTNSTVFALLGSENLMFAHWNLDPVDWRRPGAYLIAERVMQNAAPGSIILLHDGGGDRSQTVQAVALIVNVLQAEGFEFVTVEEMYRQSK